MDESFVYSIYRRASWFVRTARMSVAPWALALLCATPVSAHAIGPTFDFSNDPYHRLAPNHIPTGILIDRIGLNPDYDSGEPEAFAAATWCHLHDGFVGLRAIRDGSPAPSEGCAPRQAAIDRLIDGVRTIGILRFDHAQLKETALVDGLVVHAGNGILEEAAHAQGAQYTTGHVFRADILTPDSAPGLNLRFEVGSGSYVSDDGQLPSSLEIDLDDGLGFRSIVMDQVFSANYSQPGIKNLRLRAEYPGGVEESQFVAYATEEDEVPNFDHLELLARDGAVGYLWEYHSADGIFDKPIIIPDGFDPLGLSSWKWEHFYEHLNEANLVESLRAEGFDIVVVNFTGGSIEIERNAAVLREAIEYVNEKLADQFSNPEPLVVVGTSMGGLVSRWALRDMELNGVDHRTRLYISFDAPNQGANVPYGAQRYADEFKGRGWPAMATVGHTVLQLGAAQQMLVSQLGSLAKMQQFYSDLELMGNYPQQIPRMVAIANGSGSGLGQGSQLPGQTMVEWTYEGGVPFTGLSTWCPLASTVTASMEIRSVSNHPDLDPFSYDIECRYLNGSTADFGGNFPNPPGGMPWDTAPGGFASTHSDFLWVRPQNVGLATVLPGRENHAFVPTVSALDFDHQGDLYVNIAAMGTDALAHTPFDFLYYPFGQNTEHATINSENAVWFIREIVGELDTCDPPLFGTWRIEGDCLVEEDAIVPEGIEIGPHGVLRVSPGVALAVDLATYTLEIAAGGRLELMTGARLDAP